jgi:mannose-1-phosphate guanylyltransferase
MNAKPRSIWVAILAGGDGQHLRRSTTNARGISTSKHRCSLNSGRSSLQISLQRASAVTARERIVAVVTEAHRHWWEYQLAAYPGSRVVVEPCNRGTGLSVLLPLLVIAKSDPEAGVIFMPCDHCVEHESILAEYLREATASAVMDSDKLTLFGMSRSAPDSGFGYLSPVPDSGVGMRPVLDVVGNPAQAIAGRIAQFIALYPRQTRQLIVDLQAIVEHWRDSRIPSAELASLYTRHSALDFWCDVLHKRPVSVRFTNMPPRGWNEVDTPDRLAAARGASHSRTCIHPQLGQRGFAWLAQSPRLAPNDES